MNHRALSFMRNSSSDYFERRALIDAMDEGKRRALLNETEFAASTLEVEGCEVNEILACILQQRI